MDNSEWWADVLYKNKTKEEVPVPKIREEYLCAGVTKTKCFNPQHMTDFDRNKFYRIFTSKDLPDNKEGRFYGRIGKLAESREGLSLGGRARFAPISEMDCSEPETTSADEDPVQQPILLQKNLRVEKKKNQRTASDNDCASYLANNNLHLDVPFTSVSSADARVLELERKLAEAEEKYKKLQDSTREASAFEKFVENKLSQVTETVTNKLSQVTETVTNLQKDFQDLKGSLSERSDSHCCSGNTSTSSSSSDGDKVPIGMGYFCSKWAIDAMEHNFGNHADFACALLKGVFGTEKAKRLRVKPQNKNIPREEVMLKMEENFILIAKTRYRQWLELLKVEVNGTLAPKYSPAKVEELVHKFPGYLSDRAQGMLRAELPKAVRSGRGDKRRAGEGASNGIGRIQEGQAEICDGVKKKRPYQRWGSAGSRKETVVVKETNQTCVLPMVAELYEPQHSQPQSTTIEDVVSKWGERSLLPSYINNAMGPDFGNSLVDLT